MTYKDMAIDKLDKDNVCDADVSRTLIELHELLKDVSRVDEVFLADRLKPVLTKKVLWFMRDNKGFFDIYFSEQSIVNVFSRLIDGESLTERQINGIELWTVKHIKTFAKKWKQRIWELASDIKKTV